jgi:hypothetical protein
LNIGSEDVITFEAGLKIFEDCNCKVITAGDLIKNKDKPSGDEASAAYCTSLFTLSMVNLCLQPKRDSIVRWFFGLIYPI